jgi:membrane fusion protein (multidrug efflux system)
MRLARRSVPFVRRPWVVLATVSLVACGAGKAPGGFPAGGPVPVTVVTLKPQHVTLTRELPGRTSAFLVAEVRPQANGVIKERLFAEGALVRQGQALYQLDDAVYKAQYDSSLAALARAQALALSARLTAQRSEGLAKVDAVSAQENETAVAALGQAEADVAAARAAVETARVNLGYTRIVAPIAGRIGKSSVTAGALAVANQDAAFATIQQLDPLYVEFSQSSSEWLRLQEDMDAGRLHAGGAGTRVAILLEDGTRYAKDGRLLFSDVTVDPGTGSFILRAVVPNPSARLLPGMYVRAVLDEGDLSDGLLVPQQGITRDQKGEATALIVGADDKVEQRSVVVSRTIGDAWLVESGLKAGDRVIVEGLQKIKVGAPVTPAERSAVPGAGAPVPAAPTGR